MHVRALGYVAVGSPKVDEWAAFATQVLGMQVAERGARRLALRMDTRRQRMAIDADVAEGAFSLGWEVSTAADLQALAARLERAGVPVQAAPSALRGQRGVEELVLARDPAGNGVEIFRGAAMAATPFAPGRPVSGFRTGVLGLGHAVLTVERVETVLPFYRDVLGFHVSDYMLAPFHAYFFHVNARHHSLALIETGKNGFHHLMMELMSLDDVGQCYDIALQEPGKVSVTLGRHSNDFMTSFYMRSPSPFLLEYGWGGRSIDPARWDPVELKHGPSLWGHERDWLPEDQRATARRLRMQAAMESVRAPVQVTEGNFEVARVSGAKLD